MSQPNTICHPSSYEKLLGEPSAPAPRRVRRLGIVGIETVPAEQGQPGCERQGVTASICGRLAEVLAFTGHRVKPCGGVVPMANLGRLSPGSGSGSGFESINKRETQPEPHRSVSSRIVLFVNFDSDLNPTALAPYATSRPKRAWAWARSDPPSLPPSRRCDPSPRESLVSGVSGDRRTNG